MKKLILTILAVLTVFVSLVGCSDGTKLTSEAKVYVGDTLYTVDLGEAKLTTKNSVLDLLKALSEQEEDFDFSASVSTTFGYDAFLTSMSGLEVGNGAFIAFYHNNEEKKDITIYGDQIEVGGDTVYLSGLGIGAMTLFESVVVAFKVNSFS